MLWEGRAKAKASCGALAPPSLTSADVTRSARVAKAARTHVGAHEVSATEEKLAEEKPDREMSLNDSEIVLLARGFAEPFVVLPIRTVFARLPDNMLRPQTTALWSRSCAERFTRPECPQAQKNLGAEDFLLGQRVHPSFSSWHPVSRRGATWEPLLLL